MPNGLGKATGAVQRVGVVSRRWAGGFGEVVNTSRSANQSTQPFLIGPCCNPGIPSSTSSPSSVLCAISRVASSVTDLVDLDVEQTIHMNDIALCTDPSYSVIYIWDQLEAHVSIEKGIIEIW
jgi:hypothetical protein